MTDAPRSLDPAQLGAYFALIEVSSLLRHAVELLGVQRWGRAGHGVKSTCFKFEACAIVVN